MKRDKDRVWASWGQRKEGRQWVLLSVPATTGVWGKLLDASWNRQKQRDWHNFSLVYFLSSAALIPISPSWKSFIGAFFFSPHSPIASDKVSVEITARVFCKSGNTDILHIYQEFTAAPESIAHGTSGWKDRKVSADTSEHRCTYLGNHMLACKHVQHMVTNIQVHSRLSVWQGGGCMQQEITKVRVSRPIRRKKRGKVSCWI